MGSGTHNEATTLIINILLQQRLAQTLVREGAGTLRTDLIIHHRFTDISSKAAKLIRILDVVKKTRSLALLYQWL